MEKRGSMRRQDGAGQPAGFASAHYLTVKAFVRDKIHAGLWAPGDRVPSENELVGELGFSRMTVHRALRELASEGLIRRVAGLGTFVSDGKTQSSLLQVADIAKEIQARGGQYSCEILRQSEEIADDSLLKMLELSSGQTVFHLLCLHKENGIPVQLEDRYVNASAVPGFLKQDFTREQPGAYLLRTVPLEDVEHVVEALAATREEAARLKIEVGEPCLALTRRTWSSGVVITYVRCLHAGTRYRLGSRFKPSHTEGLG